MKNIYSIKYIDYFASKEPEVKLETYASEVFDDVYSYYKVITSDKPESIGYLVINVSPDFERRISELENL